MEEASKAQCKEQESLDGVRDELDWIEIELSDGDLGAWEDWDSLQSKLNSVSGRRGSILDWVKPYKWDGVTPGLEYTGTGMDMEVGHTVQQLEREERLWRAA